MEVDECDGEVEFLEEDADIVQKYVSKPISMVATEPDPRLEVIFTTDANYFQTGKKSNPRGSTRRRKRNNDTDEEYKPEVDMVKKKPRKDVKKRSVLSYKKRDISIIPDFGDMMFLPVKVYPKTLENNNKIKKWNDFCIDECKKADEFLYNSDSEDVAIGSKRTMVFRHVRNRLTGKKEPIVSGNTQLSLSSGKLKTSNYQCILPHFMDRKQLDYKVYPPRKTGKMVLYQHTELLNCEKQNGDDVLVCYTPKDKNSVVYKFVDKRKAPSKDSNMSHRQLEEQTCYNVCAPCYQHANTGSGYLPQRKSMKCAICGVDFPNTYTMLKHLKTHDNESLQTNKELIAQSLANLAGYHYKCRICQERFNSIKELKTHVTKTHQGKTLFKCDVGNHVTH